MGTRVSVLAENGNGIIKRYIRGNGYIKGAMIAKLMEDGTVSCGWSLCRKEDLIPGKEGKFHAIGIAENRATEIASGKLHMHIPTSIESEFITFVLQMKKYFKNRQFNKNFIGFIID